MNEQRRTFLRSATALVALPLMESSGWKRFTSVASATASLNAPPKRMVCLGFGWGVTRESWYPDRNQVGADYELPAGLQPLAKHKNDMTVIQNLSNQFSTEAHWGSTFYLTGANRYAEPGQSFHNSISADQIAAQSFGRETRFTSLQFGCEKAANSGHGPGLSMSWNREGKPIAGLDNPVDVYSKLFSGEKTPLAQRQALLKQKRSVLDTVMEDAKSVERGLSKNDTNKLTEYFQSIRDIENRLSKEEQWLEVPKAQPREEIQEPVGGDRGADELKVMYDLLVAALQVDATRVITYRQPVESLIKSLGATITGHNMSHYTSGVRKAVSETRDRKQSELFGYLIDKLKSTRESDGSRLFDHVALSYGSNINSIHYLTNCPTIVTGGGAGFKLGQHLVVEKDTPLCNLWLSTLQGLGLSAKSHGDSTGVIKELI